MLLRQEMSPLPVFCGALQRRGPAQKFANWFKTFLPAIAEGRPASLFVPATVTDRSDSKIAHLDGLNLSRAWCWRSLSAYLPHGDVRQTIMERAAYTHRVASLPHVVGDYMGEHWLASSAVLALFA